MKSFRLVLLMFSLFLLSIGVSYAQPDLTEVGNLRFFSDQTEFNSICSDTSFEDFEDTNVQPNFFTRCPEPFDTFSDNACYSPGALIPGFSITAGNSTTPNEELTTFTPTFFGATNVAVGAATVLADTIVTFTPPVESSGMVLAALSEIGVGNTTVDVRVYGPGDNFLGSRLVDVVGTSGTFIGVQSRSTLIERIELVETPPGRTTVEALYSLSFGSCAEIVRPIPTLSEWGMIALVGVIGIVGMLFVVRRRATA